MMDVKRQVQLYALTFFTFHHSLLNDTALPQAAIHSLLIMCSDPQQRFNFLCGIPTSNILMGS